jgi:hypothetical protein
MGMEPFGAHSGALGCVAGGNGLVYYEEKKNIKEYYLNKVSRL